MGQGTVEACHQIITLLPYNQEVNKHTVLLTIGIVLAVSLLFLKWIGKKSI